MIKFFDWHIHLTGSIPLEYWSKILSNRKMLNGRTLDTLKEELYMENSSAWSELKICTDTEEGFRDTVLFIVRDMIKRGVKGASFIFNPHSLINRGLDISKTFEILNPFLTNLIKKEIFYPLFRIGVNRRDGINELEYIAKLFTKERKKYLWIEAIDINGDEKKFPLNPFVPELLNLKNELIPYTIHAGEGLELASSLEDAIKCSPIRIGHGIASVFDKSLIEEIKEKRIALELCVSSNLKTFNIPFNIYPLAEIFDSGVDILLGSDNPSFINSNIENEYDLVASILGDQVLERIESTTNKYLRNRNLV